LAKQRGRARERLVPKEHFGIFELMMMIEKEEVEQGKIPDENVPFLRAEDYHTGIQDEPSQPALNGAGLASSSSSSSSGDNANSSIIEEDNTNKIRLRNISFEDTGVSPGNGNPGDRAWSIGSLPRVGAINPDVQQIIQESHRLFVSEVLQLQARYLDDLNRRLLSQTQQTTQTTTQQTQNQNQVKVDIKE